MKCPRRTGRGRHDQRAPTPYGAEMTYSPPAATPPASAPVKPARGRAGVAVVALGLIALTLLAADLLGLWTLHLLGSERPDQQARDLRDTTTTIVDVLGFAESVVAGIAVIVWLWRARANAEIIDGAAQ